jgi:MHS family proline/betaine transporter-like MFS transporter
VAGNVLEWYDFAVYAYLATVLSRKFFPPGDEVTALLATFAAFGVGFVARPLGGILIGRLGDTKGRKAALLATIGLMAFGTVLIGLIPTYEQIGALAPALVLLARIMQGFSAGGEWGGSTAFIVEWAPETRRGLYGSLQQCSVAGGLLLGSGTAALIATLLDAEVADAWGWRIPFLLGGLIGPIGLYMRRKVEETPAYRAALRPYLHSDAQTSKDGSMLAARAFGFTIVWTVSYYVVLTYMPTFLQRQVGLPRPQALWATSAGLLALMVAIPVAGYVSDRIGRKPLLLGACIALAVLPYPLFRWLLGGATPAEVVVVQIALCLAVALFSGPGPAAIAEMFPTRLRSTWMSTGYSLAVTFFGGFAPFISTWLIDRTGQPVAPSFYVAAAAVASMLVIVRMRETGKEQLQ